MPSPFDGLSDLIISTFANATVTWRPKASGQPRTFRARWNPLHTEWKPVDGAAPVAQPGLSLHAREADVQGIRQGDVIAKDGTDYAITAVRPNHRGMVVIVLNRPATRAP